MKNFKTSLMPGILAFSIFMGTLTFSNCSSDGDDSDDGNVGPCEQLECQNGGEAIFDVEFDACRCNCPIGYTGENCETEIN